MSLITTRLAVALLAGAWISQPANAADVDLTKPVPTVANRVPVRFADSPVDRTVELAMWKSDVAFGDVVGEFASGVFCSGRPFKYSKQGEQWLVGSLNRVFKERVAELGFVPADATKSVFDDKAGNSADFRFGATLLALDYRSCGGNEVKGAAYAKLRWEVFSARRQKVVYAATLESSFATERAINEKEFDRALMRTIVDNLFADPRFVEMIRSGGVAEEKSAVALTPIQVMGTVPAPGGVINKTNELRAAVVTIESGTATGTGFYISSEGYLLTNSHVVSDAKFVRIKYSDGRTAVGEVIRSDKPRDVALLRTDPVSSQRSLGIRRGDPKTGEEVYAIGSPFGDTLSGTLTRGVLSSRRIVEGVAFLQSDVSINPGNSGGPLVDSDGMVIAIAQIKGPSGINLFIPIDEALDKLGVTLGTR